VSTLVWIVQATGNPRFPYRVALMQEGERQALFAVRAADKWPGPGASIFCVRDGSPPEEIDIFEEVERVPVTGYEVFGRRISVTLDRPVRKRCEFLILEKPYRDREGSYEQIFFRTQSSISAHKSRSKVSLRGETSLSVIIDSSERYAWKFPGAETAKRKLRAGDYALVEGETILAVVERKSYDNLLGDIGQIVVLHQSLRELAGYPAAAVVIEARYGDFMDPARLKGRWPAGHCCRVLGELQAMHPSLPFIFAGTRKEANIWTWSFFRAVSRKAAQTSRDEGLFAAETQPPDFSSVSDLEARVLSLLKAAPEGLTALMLKAALGDVDSLLLRRCLTRLKVRNAVVCSSRGSKARWLIQAR